MNERVKQIRKYNKLTLEQFGVRLGVTKTAISNIENSNRNLTEQMIKSICREFNVNENWLRTGEGDMVIALSRRESIAAFIGNLMKEDDDSFKLRLIDVLADLDESEWEVLADLAQRLAAENQARIREVSASDE